MHVGIFCPPALATRVDFQESSVTSVTAFCLMRPLHAITDQRR